MAIKTNHTSNKITAAQNDLVLDTDSPLHNVSVSDKRVVNVQDPVNAQDAVTKIYLETVVGAATGQANLLLGTPPDGSFTDGAYQQFDPNQTLTEAIDDLNEVMENVRNNTFVRSVDFTANITVGGAGLTTTLNIVPEGNANRYTIEWGDGSVTTATSDSTPTHTYADTIHVHICAYMCMYVFILLQHYFHIHVTYIYHHHCSIMICLNSMFIMLLLSS